LHQQVETKTGELLKLASDKWEAESKLRVTVQEIDEMKYSNQLKIEKVKEEARKQMAEANKVESNPDVQFQRRKGIVREIRDSVSSNPLARKAERDRWKEAEVSCVPHMQEYGTSCWDLVTTYDNNSQTGLTFNEENFPPMSTSTEGLITCADECEGPDRVEGSSLQDRHMHIHVNTL